MNRTFSTSAIVVSLKPAGENNSNVTLITEARGIVYATLYGGPKSKLRSLVSQWHSGIIYLYENPEHNQIKISDFDVKNYHVSFSQNLFKYYAASLAAELAIKTKCAGSAGNNEQCWKLVSGFLDGLELATEEQGHLGLIRFLWRFLELLGVQPDPSYCGSCGKSFITEKHSPADKAFYNRFDNDFICSDCASSVSDSAVTGSTSESQFIPLKMEVIHYLSATSLLTPAESRKIPLDEAGFVQIKNFIFYLIENNIESKLYSIETGKGIL